MCKCIHASQGMVFPMFAPQPIGPKEKWPVYFIPDPTARGFGRYYCPCCREGLEQARAVAGMVPESVTPPLTFLGKLVTVLKGLFKPVPEPIRLQPTAGESQ